MDVRLVLEKDGARSRVHHLKGSETIIGRRQDCDLRVPSADVSRRHCVLTIHDGYLSVEDLDSVNGTFINGTRVAGKQVLRPGDHLEVGPARFVVEYELEREARDRLKGTQPDLADAEAEDVLPLAEEEAAAERNAFAFTDRDEGSEELPLLEQDDEADLPTAHAETADEVAEANAGNVDWQLPDVNELAKLEEKKARRARKRS